MSHEPLECLDDHGEGTCSGEVDWHSTDPGRHRAFPRCDLHWQERLERRENSMERYENSDLPPAWFSESNAGERWSEDY